MRLHHRHPWSVSAIEARAIQENLANYVSAEDSAGEIQTVAGVDVGFEDGGATTRAAVVTLSFPDLQPLERRLARRPTAFPYVPGLLSFREAPAVLDALEQLRDLPDVLLCDGHGRAHTRRFGIACHLGVLTGLASIGVGKSRLVGQYQEPGKDRGNRTPLVHKDEVVGMVLRTRSHVSPLFVSVGHRVSLERACELVLACAPRYRLPETTRLADRLASARGELAT